MGVTRRDPNIRPQYKMPPINGDLNYRYIRPVILLPRSLLMPVGNTNPIQKTSVTRFVRRLAVVDTSYWGTQQV